jgi:hypothetical protein
MPIKQNKKSTKIADAYGIKSYDDTELRKAAIVVVNANKTLDNNPYSYFMLNPSTWTENLSSNWSPQQTPGQSSPPLQWTSGGPRTVSFQALVTADTSYFVSGTTTAKTPAQDKDGLAKAVDTLIGGIASAFSKVTTPPPRVPSSDTSSDLDITKYLNYYRSLLYPTYNKEANPSKLIQSPPLVALFVGTSIPTYPIGKPGSGNLVSSQTDLWVVTSLEINITKQLPHLAPMEATVSFQLTQYNMRSYSRQRFLK